jgi:hypothetical protein
VAVTTAATLAAWLVAGRFAALDVRLSPGGSAEHVGAVTVIAVTILVGLAAWAAQALLARLVPSHARTTWLVLAIAALILSLAGPFGAGTTAATKAALACMHLLTAAILIPAFAGGQLPWAASARWHRTGKPARSAAIDDPGLAGHGRELEGLPDRATTAMSADTARQRSAQPMTEEA